ncbi:MAG: DUF4065 domain-containing protein [Gemmataceae bacterium]
MPSAASIAKEFVKLSFSGDEIDPLTNLRLQKLLYYAQAWSLVLRKSELFPDRIEAWRHGPVVPDVYNRLPGGIGNGIIESNMFKAFPDLDGDESLFINRVWDTYKQYSAWALGQKTHTEQPYIKAWGDRTQKGITRGSDEIRVEDLEEYFSEQDMPAPLAAYRRHCQKKEEQAWKNLAERKPLDKTKLSKLARFRSVSMTDKV